MDEIVGAVTRVLDQRKRISDLFIDNARLGRKLNPEKNGDLSGEVVAALLANRNTPTPVPQPVAPPLAPLAPTEKHTWLDSVKGSLGAWIASALATGAVVISIGTALYPTSDQLPQTPTPIVTPAQPDGSLLQYLEDRGRHLPRNR